MMIKSLHVKVGGQRIILYTEVDENPLSAKLLEEANRLETPKDQLEKLMKEHPERVVSEVLRVQYSEGASLRRHFGGTGVMLLPLFDYRRIPARRQVLLSPVARKYRFVNRRGLAPFPDWTTEQAGVMVHQSCTDANCVWQILLHFPAWTKSTPRRKKLSRREKMKYDDVHASYLV